MTRLPAVGDSNAYFDRVFGTCPVMAIIRGLSPDQTVALCERAWAAGVDVVEVPIQSVDAVPALRAAAAAGRSAGRDVGVGTVVSSEQVAVAVQEGAMFSVAPGLDPDIARMCLEQGLPHLPGVATATEIQTATRLGFGWLKAFPAAQLTPGWFAAHLAPFPGLRLVATGGIGADNAGQFLEAGARVVSIGSAFERPDELRRLASLIGGARD